MELAQTKKNLELTKAELMATKEQVLQLQTQLAHTQIQLQQAQADLAASDVSKPPLNTTIDLLLTLILLHRPTEIDSFP